MYTLGRRPMPPDEKLSEPITIVLSPAMRKQLEREAEAEGYRSLSAFVRERRLFAHATGKTATAHRKQE
jgi:Arc/MetJ-type ribon-helix-helix transcriptional regulator